MKPTFLLHAMAAIVFGCFPIADAVAGITFSFDAPSSVESDYTASGGTFDLLISSPDTPQTVGSIELDLIFDNFVGTLSGNTLGIAFQPFVGTTSSVSVDGSNPFPATVSDGDLIEALLRLNTFAPLGPTPVSVGTFTFTGAAGSFPQDDFFDVSVGPDTTSFGPPLFIAMNANAPLPTATIGRASAVPEPSMMLAMAAIGGGAFYRKRRRPVVA